MRKVQREGSALESRPDDASNMNGHAKAICIILLLFDEQMFKSLFHTTSN